MRSVLCLALSTSPKPQTHCTLVCLSQHRGGRLLKESRESHDRLAVGAHGRLAEMHSQLLSPLCVAAMVHHCGKKGTDGLLGCEGWRGGGVVGWLSGWVVGSRNRGVIVKSYYACRVVSCRVIGVGEFE